MVTPRDKQVPHAGFLAMMLIFLALLGAGLAYTIDRNKQGEIELHRQVAENRNRMFEYQVTRTFGLVETTLLTLADQLDGPASERQQTAFTAQLVRALRFAPHLRSISLLDADGYIIASSNPGNLRQHPDPRGFQGVGTAQPGQLYVGLPWSGRDFADGQALGLSPVQRSNGLGGFIAVSLPLRQSSYRLIAAINSDYFINQFTLAVNPHENEIELLRYDGRLLLTTGEDDGERIGQPHRDLVYADRLPQAEFGALLEDQYEGQSVLSTYRTSRQYPLLITSHTRQQAILARWQSETRLTLAIAVPLLLALLLLGLWLHLELRQRQGHRAAAQQQIQQRLRAILDSLPAAVVVLDQEGRIEFANAVWQEEMARSSPGLPPDQHGLHYLELNRHLHTHGWSEQHSLVDDIARLLSGQIEQSDQEAMQQRERSSPPEGGHDSQLRSERSWRRVLGRRIHGDAVRSDDGGSDGALLMLVDITQQKKDTEQLRLAARIFDSTAEGLMISDAANRILWINPAFSRITGYSLEEVQGKTPSLLKSGLQDRHFYQVMWDALQESGSWQGEILNRRKDGTVYPEWLTVSALVNPAGEITHYIAIFSDISERKASEDRIRHLSEHDFLTGLPNRLLFQDRLAQSIVQARRHPTRFALLFIDLDRFKSINDSLGHPVGDRLLQHVAQRLEQSIRSSDTLCRQGGDEFMILLRDLQAPEDPARIAEKILAALDRPFAVDRHMLSITPSIGIAMYPADGVDSDTLIRHAETAMYAAKESGRNAYRFFHHEMNDHAASRLAIEEGLRRALRQQEFELFYQPQVAIGSGKIVGIEALVRWHDPQYGLRPPDSFIPIAEDSGQIIPIGSWVLRAACRQARAWRDAGLPPLPVSVNVAALQFATPTFIGEVEDALRDEGLDSSAIELEVTESMLLDTTDEVLAVLARLRQLGVRLSIDDFGTGYSSLSYLHKLPVDKLKVDRSFIHDLRSGASGSGFSSEGAKITEAIIRMAHSLGLNVIAEGVETFDQLEFLHRLGCDGYQGFFYSMPVTAPEIEVLLRQAGNEVVEPLVKQ